MAPVEKNSQAERQKGKVMTAIERILQGNAITTTKDIHNLTEDERATAKNGINSVIEIQIENAFITGGTLEERSNLVGEKITAHITPDCIRDEEDAEMYILEDCILIVGYTICAILDSKPWEGVDFPCRLIHDLRG